MIIAVFCIVSVLCYQIETFINNSSVISNEGVQNINSLYNNKKIITNQMRIENNNYSTDIDNKGNITVNHGNDKKYTLNKFGDMEYPSKQQWKTIVGKKMSGFVHKTVESVNANKCELLCDDDPFCMGYLYDKTDSKCSTLYMAPAKNQNMVSGIVQYNNGVRNGIKRYNDKWFGFSFNMNKTSDIGISECENSCLNDSNCSGYHYDSNRSCFHYPFEEYSNITTGIKTV